MAQAASYTYYGGNGTWDTSSRWRAGALTATAASGASAITDYKVTKDADIYFVPTGGATNLTFNVWADADGDGVNDFTIKSFTYSTAYDTGAQNNPKLTVSQDLIITGDFTRKQENGGNKKFWIVGAATLTIGGNVSSTTGPDTQLSFGETGTTLNKLVVGGNITSATPIFFNVANGASIAGLVNMTTDGSSAKLG